MPSLSENEVFNHGDGPGNQVKRKRKREQTTDASTEEYDVELAFETMKMEPIVSKEQTADESTEEYALETMKMEPIVSNTQTTDESTEEYDVELALETMKMEPIVPKTENEKTSDEMRATFLTRCRKLKLATTLNLPGCT
jgi:predicted transglutaminase-like protease